MFLPRLPADLLPLLEGRSVTSAAQVDIVAHPRDYAVSRHCPRLMRS